MKRLLLFLLMSVSFSLIGQTRVSTKVLGTRVSTTIPTNKVFDLDVKIPKTQSQQIGKSSKTSNTAIYKKESYPVYQTTKGKLFIVYPNKDNTGYNKKYIKTD